MGANYRVSELQAALLNVAIERFPAQAKQREELAAYMDEALSEVSGVRVLPRDVRHTTRSFYRYVFAIDPDTSAQTMMSSVPRCTPKEFPAGKATKPCITMNCFNRSSPSWRFHRPSLRSLILLRSIYPLPNAPANMKPSGWMRAFSAPAVQALTMPSLRSRRFQERLSSDKNAGAEIRRLLDEYHE